MSRTTRRHRAATAKSQFPSTPIPPASVQRSGAAVAAGLLFLSGIPALVYQTLWVKQLSLVVGTDVHAVTVAVSAFFAGLAVGSYLFGRWADQFQRPILLFTLIEVGVGLLGVGATLALANSARLFATLEGSAGPVAWLLPFALVGLPAAVMGGSLPVLVRALAGRTGQVGTAGGRLYAANTAGAVAGTLLAAFVLIPRFGVFGSSLVAAAINVAAALGSIVLGRSNRSEVLSTTVAAAGPSPIGSRLALVLYAVAGGLALAYEVVWTQVVVQWTSTRTFAFAVVLAVYLSGLVLGSACFARRADRVADPWGCFGLLIAAAGTVAVLLLLILGDWLHAAQVRAATLAFQATGSEPAAMAARFLVAAVCVVLPPTLLLGAAFPVALRLACRATRAGHDSGAVLGLNTLGGIVGALATGFLLVPSLGLERSLAVLAASAAVVGAVAVVRGRSSRPSFRWATLACGCVAVAAAVLLPPDHMAQLLAKSRKGTLVFHESGTGGMVAVLEQRSGANTFRRLYVQGVSNSGDSMSSLRYMRLQALLPLIIHRDEPRSVLVIGLGTGITAGSLLTYDGLDRRVCAELLPEVAQAASRFRGNYGVTTDPRVEIRLRDGRRELLRSNETYDVITLEPPPPSAAGVVNLYSRDFYELAAARLNPDGLVAQWLPLPTQTDADTRSLVRSFLDVFPFVTLWTTEVHEMMLVGSLSLIELNAPRIAERFNRPGVSAALREVGVDSPAALLATFVCDRSGLERYSGDAPPVTDDRPRIEYGPWVLPGEFERTLPRLLDLQTNPPLTGADATQQEEISHRREVLHSFYATAIYAYHGDRIRWGKTIVWVMHKEPGNPYYRWFANRTGQQ
jgi:spermidine synthase